LLEAAIHLLVSKYTFGSDMIFFDMRFDM